jgi:flagellar basal body-associated protein FliL
MNPALKTILSILAVALAAGLATPAEAASAASRKPTFSESYVVVDPFQVAIIEERRVKGTLHVEFGLDIPSAAARERMTLLMPRLRDAYLRIISRYAATRTRMGRTPDVVVLKEKLQAVTNRAADGEDAQVLLMNVMVRAAR